MSSPKFASGDCWKRDALPVAGGVNRAIVLAVVDPAAFCYDFRQLCL